MLHLAADTHPDWLAAALGDVGLLLLDHAHCERKAASTAISLTYRYGDDAGLMAPLSALAREELAHFELVLGHLEARGLSFRRLEPAPYAARLLAAARKPEPDRLVDTLLCCALIEARSCERMKLLAEALPEPALAALYRGLLASEARHHMTYVDLALARAPAEAVWPRLAELAAHEAAVLEGGGPLRMHS